MPPSGGKTTEIAEKYTERKNSWKNIYLQQQHHLTSTSTVEKNHLFCAIKSKNFIEKEYDFDAIYLKTTKNYWQKLPFLSFEKIKILANGSVLDYPIIDSKLDNVTTKLCENLVFNTYFCLADQCQVIIFFNENTGLNEVIWLL